MELWKIYPYNNNYEISNLGNVRNVKRKKNNLKPKINRGGYLVLDLCKNGLITQKTVHRLVCETFMENPFNLPTINHINENKKDNRLENLEYMSVKDNLNYGNRRINASQNTKKKIACYNSGYLIKIYDGAIDAEKDGFCRKCISNCVRGKSSKHKGFVWEYYETQKG